VDLTAFLDAEWKPAMGCTEPAAVAWTPAAEGHGCTRFEAAGTLVGQTADRLSLPRNTSP
jgi:hypothetical protein